MYVSERFSDYNYEELVQTETSTEYDLSLLELEELKELKASLEKKLGMFKLRFFLILHVSRSFGLSARDFEILSQIQNWN